MYTSAPLQEDVKYEYESYAEKIRPERVPEISYDDVAFLAFIACNTPIAAVVLLEGEEVEVLAESGATLQSFPGAAAFYALATLTPHTFTVIPDLCHDPRFMNNPLVREGPRVRFYAGVSLLDSHGEAFGTLCVADTVPRDLTLVQRGVLQTLARQVATLLLLRRQQVELEHTNTLLMQRSVTDGLTGLVNRRGFEEQLEAEVERSQRSQRYRAPLSLLMVDVDYFKRYNDTFGHPAADQVLRRLASLLNHSVRRVDTVARYGGEEFAIIMPAGKLKDALLLAERCRKTVEEAPWPQRNVTVSVGVASLAQGSQDGGMLVEAADQALYRAKRGGRNRVVSAQDTSAQDSSDLPQ